MATALPMGKEFDWDEVPDCQTGIRRVKAAIGDTPRRTEEPWQPIVIRRLVQHPTPGKFFKKCCHAVLILQCLVPPRLDFSTVSPAIHEDEENDKPGEAED